MFHTFQYSEKAIKNKGKLKNSNRVFLNKNKKISSLARGFQRKTHQHASIWVCLDFMGEGGLIFSKF